MIGALTTEPGYYALTIDGATSKLPKALAPEEPLRLVSSPSASGGTSVTGIWGGDGMPNVLDSLALTLPYDTDDTCAALADQIEALKASGIPHDVCYWKQRIATYTLAEDQQVVYLPRRDAYGLAYSGFTDSGNMVAALLNGSALTVVYQTSVADTDSVPSGELWVSETAIDHPDTGKANVLRCKTGHAIADGDTLVLRYFPVYRMMVESVATVFTWAGREDKTVKLVEID